MDYEATITIEWEWQDYDGKDCYSEITVEVEFSKGTSANFYYNGDPDYLTIEITNVEGDELNAVEENKVIEHISENLDDYLRDC